MSVAGAVQFDDIQPGYGVIRSNVGGSVALAKDILYTCDYVFGRDTFTGIDGQIPIWGRYPDPILVRAHAPNVVFPAYLIRGDTGGVIQPFMPPEMPDFAACGGGQ